jgi:hypothetical protein
MGGSDGRGERAAGAARDVGGVKGGLCWVGWGGVCSVRGSLGSVRVGFVEVRFWLSDSRNRLLLFARCSRCQNVGRYKIGL